MKNIMIGTMALAATSMLVGACTTRETRIIQTPAVVGAAPGSTTTVIRTNRASPVVVESEDERDIIVNVD
jgi:hypothetical protein